MTKPARIRNFSIIAHIDHGKSTLADRFIQLCGGLTDREMGDQVLDSMDIERERGITIKAQSVTLMYDARDGNTYQLNIIDTPGHVDFTAEVERSMRVLDGAVAVFCGVAGVQPQSETVWRQATKYGVPRIAFVNKMDRTGANFANVVSEMREKLGAPAHPVGIPIGFEEELVGLIDVVNQKALIYDPADELGSKIDVEEIPDGLKVEAETALEELIEVVGDLDDQVMGMLLNDEPIQASSCR